MFNPQPGNNEFIELYNLSETNSIDLNSYKIKYYTSSADIITEISQGSVLPPKSYAIILEGDYDFSSGIYNELIPPGALILKISDNAFGSSGMSNSSDRPVRLLNPTDDTLDAVIYSANNSATISDEKIFLNHDSSASNWANSLNVNGTPGFHNSVTPYNYNLKLSSFSIFPEIVFEGGNVQITAVVKNAGTETANSFSEKIYNDVNFDSVGNSSELIFSQNFFNLLPGDSTSAVTNLLSLNAGEYQLIAKVDFTNDEDTTDNKQIKTFTVFPPGNEYNDMVINEIMYAPSTGEPEWVELFNRSDHNINLNKWKFSDNLTTVTITTNDVEVEPDSFVVLSKDSSIFNFFTIPSKVLVFNIPSLNNSGDAVVIKDSLNVLLDSVYYFPEWGGNSDGKSLERIDAGGGSNNPGNWGTSVNIFKATPGYINSMSPKNYDLKISKFKPDVYFGIIGQQAKFRTVVANPGLNQSNNFQLKIYLDMNKDSIPQPNELQQTFNGNSLLHGDSTEFLFTTGSFIEGENYFIAKVEVNQDEDTTNNTGYTKLTGVNVNEIRGDLIINEFMYTPDSPQPEWIEIYNKSSKVINLENYQLSDNRDTVKIINQSVDLNPHNYFVISKDSSILNFFPINSDFIVSNFPSLNNTGDKIILIDSLSRTIDSLQYYSSWGGNDGISLEKLSPEMNPTDSSSWKTSISRFKGTPGNINSVTPKTFDLELNDIVFTPPFPQDGDDVSVSIKIKNKGSNSANFSVLLYEDTNLDSIPDVFLKTVPNLFLNSNDSSIVQTGYVIQNLQTKKGFYSKVIFNNDEDTLNNFLYKTIQTGFPPQSIVINEIMYNPSGGEPEWIEIYNTTAFEINLKSWKISDVVTTPVVVQIGSDVLIQPHSYFVITKSSSIINYHRYIPSGFLEINLPVLNNDSDGMILKDNRGQTIDSVFFHSSWGGSSGESLERKKFEISSNLQNNWGASLDVELSTPGRINSLTPKHFDISVSGINFSPRFPVPGEDVSVNAKVKNYGSAAVNNFSIQFLIDTDSNQVVDSLLSFKSGLSLLAGDSIATSSNKKIRNLNSKILTGVKINLSNDEDTLNNYYEKSVEPGFPMSAVSINEVMYDPEKGEPEWIELVNRSDNKINLKYWSVSDLLTIPTKNYLSDADLFIQPGELFIVTKDTSFNSFHPGINSKIIVADFGTLGNSEDGIIIYDFRDGIIDSLKYNSDWGGKNGYSLERISLKAGTNDSTNWATSLSKNRSTPGEKNSISDIAGYKSGDLVINEIMYEPDQDNNEFLEFYNKINDSINVGGWRIEDEKKNNFKLSDTSIIIPPGHFFLLSADSTVIKKYSIENRSYKNILNVSGFNLSNSGGLILLKDIKSNLIDSVWYSKNWHNKNFNSTKNISLERINPGLGSNDPSNWSSCVSSAGATPLLLNSIFTNNQNREAKISVSPNPFSPDNDGFEDFTIVNYNLSQPTSQVRIKIFDSHGRLVRNLANNQPSGSKGSVIFNGLDNSGRALRIGIYIVFLESVNDNSGIAETLKTVIVVARKL